MRFVLFCLCIRALAWGDARAQSSEGPFESGLSHLTVPSEGCGSDFIHASTTTRTQGLCAVPHTCPIVLPMPSLPPGALECRTIAVWSYFADSVPPNDVIVINGFGTSGSLLGSGSPDVGSGKTYGVCYWGPVSNHVDFGAFNTIDGVCDGMLLGESSSLGAGITLVTIYCNVFHNGPRRIVELYGGYTSTQTSPTGFAEATLPLFCGYGGGPVRLLVNALDGQQGSDSFWINGEDVSGTFPGTFAAGDAWVGLVGHCPSDNLYDVAIGDAGRYMTLGDKTLTIRSGGGSDRLAHTLVAVSHAAYEDCFDCDKARFCGPPSSPSNTARINIDHCSTLLPDCTNDVRLSGAPPGQFACLLVGEAKGVVTDPPGALGDLCVAGGCVSRFVEDAGATAPDGSFSVDISASLSAGAYGLPGACGGMIDPGETWHFQYWHRDGMQPSRFSEALSVTFR